MLLTDIFWLIKSRIIRWARLVASIRNKKNAYGILVGKPGRQRPLRRPRCCWEANLKVDLKEIGWGA
jgi:hypothetical protein